MSIDAAQTSGTPDSPATRRALAALERERKEAADNRRTVWAFVWILFAFKIVTVGVIWYVAAGSRESTDLIMATTWFWLAIPAFAIAGPMLYRWRLVRQRRRREALRQAEWSTGGGVDTMAAGFGSVHGIVPRPGDPPPM